MPDGPSRPLWPGIATAAAPQRGQRERDVPGASAMHRRPAARRRRSATLAIAASGRTTPVTFEAWVATARHGPGARARQLHSSRSISPVFPSARTISSAQRAGLLQVAQRPHHGVVLERRRDDAPAVGGQPVDREVEPLGRVLREDQLVRRLRAEQVGEPLAREAHRARRRDRAAVPRAAGVAAGVLEELLDRLQHHRRLGPRGGRVVEVDVRSLISTHDPMRGRDPARVDDGRRGRSRRGTTRRRSGPARRARAGAAGRRPRGLRRSRAAARRRGSRSTAQMPDGVVPAAISRSSVAAGDRAQDAEGDPRGDEQRDRHP